MVGGVKGNQVVQESVDSWKCCDYGWRLGRGGKGEVVCWEEVVGGFILLYQWYWWLIGRCERVFLGGGGSFFGNGK